jgi:hypothetical protein
MSGIMSEWRCFHCDAVLTDRADAAVHFGKYDSCDPICSVGAVRYRDLEDQLAQYRSESDAASKSFYEMGSKHALALIAAEERGYEKGMRDGQYFANAAPEVLEALKYFVHQMDSFRDRDGNQEDAYYHFAKGHDAAWERARAAIAKAEGLADDDVECIAPERGVGR